MTTYKGSGVDIAKADKLVDFIRKRSKTIGGFAGVFDISKYLKGYSLVGTTDGVGTKLKIAFMINKHDTVGIDLVAMNANDLICVGATPLFFLDYYACGKLDLKKSRKIIDGIIIGCKEAEMELIGGETAEMPGFYLRDEYDLAGFAVGIVKNSEIIDGRNVRKGDIIIGLKSSGFHSNGYSLIRKVLEKKGLLKKYAYQLITPTRIYVKDIKKIRQRLKNLNSDILSIAHITGSGIAGNLERVINKNVRCVVEKSRWEVPQIMREIQRIGNIPEKEMFSTFNMGIGMILIVREKDAKYVIDEVKDAVIIGVVEKGKGEVIII